jgi:hypothetical protein
MLFGLVKFPWTENPKSEVHALVIAEQTNPPRQYAIKCDLLCAIHKCLGPLGNDERAVDEREG